MFEIVLIYSVWEVFVGNVVDCIGMINWLLYVILCLIELIC